MVAGTLVLQLIFNLTLLISLIRKRKNRVVDPIHSTISAARQSNRQLNKVNFISLMMCMNCLLLNITVFAVSIVLNGKQTDVDSPRKSRLIVELICLAIIAAKVPTLILISKKLRLIVISALTCGSGSRNQPRLRPKSKLKKRSQFANSIDMLPWKASANAASGAAGLAGGSADTNTFADASTSTSAAAGSVNDAPCAAVDTAIGCASETADEIAAEADIGTSVAVLEPADAADSIAGDSATDVAADTAADAAADGAIDDAAADGAIDDVASNATQCK